MPPAPNKSHRRIGLNKHLHRLFTKDWTSAREDAAKLSFSFEPILTLPSLMAAALEKEFVSALADLCLGRLWSSSLPESTRSFHFVIHFDFSLVIRS